MNAIQAKVYPKKKIFVYRLALKRYFSVNITDILENRIINEAVKFLGKVDKLQLERDPLELLDYIEKWLNSNFKQDDINTFCEIIRDKFYTRARERDRSLLFLNQKDENYLYIIHLKQPEDLIDSNFEKFITPGFGKSMILRVFRFTKIQNEYYVHFWEKYLSKMLYNLFNLETDYYDYSSLVKIGCKIENFKTILTLSPDKFDDLLKRNKIKFNEKENELTLKGITITVNSLRVMGKSFKVNEYEKFKSEVLKFRDRILIDTEFKKKEFLDLKNSLNIFEENIQLKFDDKFKWKKPQKKWKIIENRKHFIIEVENQSHRFDKGEMEYGLILFLEENPRHILSETLLEIISKEIILRSTPERIYFAFLDYAPHDYGFEIGNFEISNYSGLKDEDLEEIKKLQQIFSNEDLTKRQKILIVKQQLEILSHSKFYQLQYFAKKIQCKITPTEVIELEFKELDYKEEPLHVLSNNAYEAIIEKTLNFGRELERTSTDYIANSDENTIRNFFLSMYSIINDLEVTGESRNFHGKTDILLRHNKHNIMVIECKIWYGIERFKNGTNDQPGVIDQLFEYLTWRENNTLILLFVTRKDIQKITKKIPILMKDHSLFKEVKEFSNKNLKSINRAFLYTYNHPRDNNLEAKIGIIVFHFPNP